MAGICLGVTVLLFVALPGSYAWCGGFAAGAAAQLVKFGVLDIAIVRRIAAGNQGAAGVQVRNTFLFLVLLGLAAVVVWKMGWNVWAMVAGIFAPRLILLADVYVRPNPFGTPTSDRELPEG